jgi:hypothetical protein
VAAPAITTHQSGTSTVKVNGATVADQSDSQTDGRVSTVAIYGTRSTPEVRTAARSAVNGELAANVRMDDKQKFSFTQVDETISAATLEIHSAPDNALLRHASLDFILPASFMEVTSNLGAAAQRARDGAAGGLAGLFCGSVQPQRFALFVSGHPERGPGRASATTSRRRVTQNLDLRPLAQPDDHAARRAGCVLPHRDRRVRRLPRPP